MSDAVIELECPGCRAALRIPVEALGREVACPACSRVFTAKSTLPSPVPSASTSVDPESAEIVTAFVIEPAAPKEWFMLAPEGLKYGPVDRETLERWVREGRVTADCGVRSADESTWRSAASEFPALAVQETQGLGIATIVAGGNPEAAAPHTVAAAGDARTPGSPWRPLPSRGGQPTLTAQVSPPTLAGQMAAHRGPLILTLAIVGVFVQCPIFSVMAWVMGSADLEEMSRGRMDPSGSSITRTGRNLGLILSLFWIMMAVILVACGLFVVAVRAAPR